MRPLLCRLAGLLLLLCPLLAQAQSGFSQTATIQVDIASGNLMVFVENPLDFGTVIAGSGVNTIALTSPSAGKFRVQGVRNTNVNMTLSPPAVLTNGAGSIPFAWQAAKNENDDIASAAVAVGASHILRLRHRVSAQVGNGWLYIHGSINVSNGALPPGIYSGVFTVTASYN